jgi:hypothetical protein
MQRGEERGRKREKGKKKERLKWNLGARPPEVRGIAELEPMDMDGWWIREPPGEWIWMDGGKCL